MTAASPYGPRWRAHGLGKVAAAFLAVSALLLLACSGNDAGEGLCATTTSPLPDPARWRQALDALDQSIAIAQAGDTERAGSLFFASAHDPIHLVGAHLCQRDRKVSSALQKALDTYHVEYSTTQTGAELAANLRAIRDRLNEAAAVLGIQAP